MKPKHRSIRAALAVLFACALFTCAAPLAAQDSAVQKPEVPRWRIAPLQGTPRLFVDGRPCTLFYNQFYYSEPGQEPFFTRNQEMAGSGFTVITVSLYKDRDKWWLGPGRYDWTAVDRRIHDVLRAAPHAALLMYIELNPPDWWVQSHEDELAQYDHRLPDIPRHVGLINSKIGPSYALQLWQRETAQMLTDTLAHIRDSDYGPSVIGATLIGGGDVQWYHVGDWGASIPQPPNRDTLKEAYVPDYSPRMVEYFRGYLHRKYQTEDALRKAWNDPAAGFDSAQIPSVKERLSVMPGQTVFWNPRTEQKLIDYSHCYYAVQSDTILAYAHAVKAEFGNRFLTSAYGAVACSDYSNGMNILGRTELARLIASPDLDCIVSVGYSQRFLGFPDNFTNANGSMALHGKLLIEELDHRTFLAKADYEKVAVHGYVPTFEQTQAMFRRELCSTITRPVSAWFYDIYGGAYHDDRMQQMFRQFNDITSKALAVGDGAHHEVAVIVDDRSAEYQPLYDMCLNGNIVNFQRTHLGRMGAPYDTFLVSDLGKADLAQYKCFIFLNTFLLTPTDRKVIKSKICRDGRVVCWTFAPGYLDGATKASANITDISGFKVTANTQNWSSKTVKISTVADPLITGLAGRDTCKPYSYKMYPYDPTPPAYGGTEGFSITGAPSLGDFSDGSGCALAVKRMRGWTSVLNCSPYWDAGLLHNALRMAKVHIYDDDTSDAIYACDRFVGIHTSTGGAKTIRLPRKSDVRDVFTGKPVAQGVSAFTVQLPSQETGLYELEPTAQPNRR